MDNPLEAAALQTDSSFLLRVWIDETFEVEASREDVFARMAELDQWPRWVPKLVAVWRSKGAPAQIGTLLFMVIAFPVLQRIILPCTIRRWGLDALEWGGGLAWSGVRHRFELTQVGPGRTRVRHVEYATGLLGLFFRPFEGFAFGFDHGWSEAIRATFPTRAAAPSAVRES